MGKMPEEWLSMEIKHNTKEHRASGQGRNNAKNNEGDTLHNFSLGLQQLPYIPLETRTCALNDNRHI